MLCFNTIGCRTWSESIEKREGLAAKTNNSAVGAAARGCRMDTKRFGAALVALLSLLATPTLTLAQTAAATGATPLVSVQKLRGDIYEFNYLLTTGVGRYHQI